VVLLGFKKEKEGPVFQHENWSLLDLSGLLPSPNEVLHVAIGPDRPTIRWIKAIKLIFYTGRKRKSSFVFFWNIFLFISPCGFCDQSTIIYLFQQISLIETWTILLSDSMVWIWHFWMF
jgi:hypothetical protein